MRCECTVEADGVLYNGTSYRSLSSAAMAASKDLGLGHRAMNGFLFWGLIKQPARETDPVAAREQTFRALPVADRGDPQGQRHRREPSQGPLDGQEARRRARDPAGERRVMGDDFFRTRMGQRFFEATMPKIADQLEHLNANLEALLVELRKRSEAPASAGSQQPPAESK